MSRDYFELTLFAVIDVEFPFANKCKLQAPVVQKVDSSIHRINHYPVDSAIGFSNNYPLDRDLSSGKCYPAIEQLGPGS